ncbi:hypothetical protein BKA83DRAFT_4125694 [Pisolithus microcarpus]|nr:hypothetical protein BKA83DRAFT_4125694 [Pisolithus microcarpus]
MCGNCGYDGTYRCVVVPMVIRLIYLSVHTVVHSSEDALTGRGAVIRKRSRNGFGGRISQLLLAVVGECVTVRKNYGAVPCLSVVLWDIEPSVSDRADRIGCKCCNVRRSDEDGNLILSSSVVWLGTLCHPNMVQATKGCCRDHSRWIFFDLECCEIMIVRRKAMLLSRLHKGVSQTREKKKKKLSQDGWPSMSSPKTHSYVYTKLLMQTSKQPGRNDINRIFKGDSAGWMSAVSPHATSCADVKRVGWQKAKLYKISRNTALVLVGYSQ